MTITSPQHPREQYMPGPARSSVHTIAHSDPHIHISCNIIDPSGLPAVFCTQVRFGRFQKNFSAILLKRKQNESYSESAAGFPRTGDAGKDT
jgi:hypothetical protein